MNQLDVPKAVQAFGVLLRREGKRAGRLRLLKLLYMADRKSIEKTGAPILGSKYEGMKHGPLHSEILDLINGYHIAEPIWSAHFRTSGREIFLESEPETGKLSRSEIGILNEVVEENIELGDWEVVERTHGFAEWTKNYPDPSVDTSKPISLDDILDAVGRSTDRDSIKQDLQDEEAYKQYFSRLSS